MRLFIPAIRVQEPSCVRVGAVRPGESPCCASRGLLSCRSPLGAMQRRTRDGRYRRFARCCVGKAGETYLWSVNIHPTRVIGLSSSDISCPSFFSWNVLDE